MRDVPEAMIAGVESGAATLCHGWILRPRTGAPLGFTDHDRPLGVDGVTCAPASGWTAGAADAATGLAPGDVTIGGGLDDVLSEAEILEGRFDGARVESWKIDWARPEIAVRLWVGEMARIRRDGDAFVAELAGPMTALERVVGRTYSRQCDAVLGDGRCRVDLGEHPGATCNKRWLTCGQVFDNTINFQGFPDIPGDDFLTAYPAAGGGHDGGSRR